MFMNSSNPRRILFLCSGGGGNLRFVHQAINNNWLDRWSKISVVADRECPALDYARRQSFETACEDFSETGQYNLLDAVRILQPDIVITTVHRILREPLLDAYKSRLFNLHYSFLPAFAGTIGVKPVMAAMDYGACLVGATVHLVTDTVDGGVPQTQIALPMGQNENLTVLMDSLFRAGCIALYTALKRIENPSGVQWTGGSLKIASRNALINPYVSMPHEFDDEAFWLRIKT